MTTSPHPHPMRMTGVRSRPLVSTIAALVGAVFLLVGILGFIPGITTNYDEMKFAGHDSGALLLGTFQVSILHNLIHLVFGLAGLAMSRTAAQARTYLVGGGIIYALIWLYGLIVDKASSANFVPLNKADDWLHLAIAAGMVLLGLLLPMTARRTTS
jgi:arginine exporter protein ArgO